MNDVVYLKLQRPDPESMRRASRIAVSDLYEALPAESRERALMSSRIRPLISGVRIAGPAVTARCAPNDNLMMHQALLIAEPGDVLVVDGGTPSAAQWGYLAAVYAKKKGISGVVIEGCIRDVDALVEHRSPVWFRDISPAHPEKKGAGAVNVSVLCGGVPVRPGDLVCADADGVLVVRREDVETVVAAAERRASHEAAAVEAIQAGQSLFDIHGLAAAIEASGSKVIDGAWTEETH